MFNKQEKIDQSLAVCISHCSFQFSEAYQVHSTNHMLFTLYCCLEGPLKVYLSLAVATRELDGWDGVASYGLFVFFPKSIERQKYVIEKDILREF